MDSADLSLPRRANGRPAACDPCRARKVACDHTRPTCKRCQKRKQAGQCVYSEAAWTPKSPTRGTVSPSVQELEAMSSRPAPAPMWPLRNTIDIVPGYLGFTSHNDVLEETSNSLSLLDGSGSLQCDLDIPEDTSHQGIRFDDLSLELRERCLLVLRCFPGQSNEQMMLRDTEPEAKGFTYIVVDLIVRSLEGPFDELLSQGEPGLRAMAEILCNNTARPVRDDISDPQEWLAQYTGPNLRWESLGLLWAHMASVSDMLDSLLGRRIEWISGKESVELARVSLGYCVRLSRQFSDGNVFLVDICRRKASLDSIVDGDAGISSSVSCGVAIAVSNFIGLHVLENDASYRPSLSSEYKRRIVAQLFTSDKLNTAFTGRPPYLSRRYYSTPLPFDIRDEVLASDEVTRMQAFQALDERGWNTHGGLYPVTIIRARCMMAVIRDEIFEISLSKGVFVTVEHLLDIKAREIAMFSQLPPSLIYNPQDLNTSTLSSTTLYVRILMQLEHYQTLFFVERLLLSQRIQEEGDLLVISFVMITLALKLWTHKDRFSDINIRRHYEWLLITHAVPGGGILCQELLLPTFTGAHPKDPGLTRSSIIQQLSLLIGFLDWVPENAPNWSLCRDSKAIIQRVLDHHLNSPGEPGRAPESMDWSFANQPDYNFELLDTFDWVRTDP